MESGFRNRVAETNHTLHCIQLCRVSRSNAADERLLTQPIASPGSTN
jgi:hypothetical protein